MNYILGSACLYLEGWFLTTFASRGPLSEHSIGLCPLSRSTSLTDRPISSQTGSFPCTLSVALPAWGLWPSLGLSFPLGGSDSPMMSDTSKWWCQKEKQKWFLILKLLVLLRRMLSEGHEHSFAYFVLLKIIVNRIVLLVILCRFEFVLWILSSESNHLRPAVFYRSGKQIFQSPKLLGLQ